MKYSIVTPVYNSFDLMGNFFNTLEKFDKNLFELIIVDDCSTDDSYERLMIKQKNTKLDMKVFRTRENAGPGNARNIGINEANGEWITFVDNDDWLSEEWLDEIEDVTRNHEIDMVIYNYFNKSDNRETEMKSLLVGEEGFVTKESVIKYITNHTVGKVYRTKLLRENNVNFPPLRRCEDVAFTVIASSNMNKIYYLDCPLYYYYQRSDSLSNNEKLGEEDLVKAFEIVGKELFQKFPEQIMEKSIRDLLYGGVLLLCKSNASRDDIITFINSYEKKYPKWFNIKYDMYLGMAKVIFLKMIKKKKILALRILAKVHTNLVGKI